MDPKIVDAIKKSAAVPSMPQVVTRFLEVIQDPNFDYESVVKVLSVDAGTVSEILRLANSALFGVARKVTSLKQALTLLGPRRTRSMVLGRFLAESMSTTAGGSIDTTYFWRRSLGTAVIGARLADAVNPKLRDEVFVCALLADIGIPILSQAMPDQYAAIAARYSPHGEPFTADDERAAVGCSHPEVAAMVLAEWALPDTMCSAVLMSHVDTATPDDDASRVGMIINASDRIARLLSEIPDVSTCAEVCGQAMEFIGVELDVLAGILDRVEADVEELASILRIDVIPSAVYSKIADSVKTRLTTPVGG